MELLASNDRDGAASDVLEAIGEDFAVCKEDCSLCGTTMLQSGFELVTAPAIPEITLERFGRLFDAIEEAPRGSDLKALRSWTSGHCGIHVHVSRPALSSLQLGRLLVFINAPENRVFVETIAGRTGSKYAKMAAKKLTDGTSRNASSDRYEAINTTYAAFSVAR